MSKREGPSGSQLAQQPTPRLRGLGPAYDEKQHGRHAAVLLQALSESGQQAPKNIALAGHYGSGKSSVILGAQQELEVRKVRYVNLSLSSLGFDDSARARVQADGSVPPLTNLIQKEIVKQLLYRKAPSEMPGSRYFRIDAFRPLTASLWSAIVGIAFLVGATLLGLRERLEKAAPQSLVELDRNMGWFMLLTVGIFVAGVWFLGLRTFQSRLRVESVSAGGAALTLKAKENSYFDQYLDEIVYFFQRTRTAIAIFEDLDRFKDPHIFETLRELNTVLNNSDQITSRPIRFVYAVRDSIFEDLAAAQVEEQVAGVEGVLRKAATLEARPSTNRTKFFDLVIPMVPFLTHRSARDLIAWEFEGAAHKPTSAVVNLVGTHLTDMRLIRNIRNEFEMYSASILGPQGLKGLAVDRLFAMMVYKNLYLEDFERIRLGTSQIDAAYSAYRSLVQYQTTEQSRISARALAQIKAGAAWDGRAAAAGQRLRALVPIFFRATGYANQVMLQHRSTTYQDVDFGSPDLWRSMLKHKDSVRLYNNYGHSLQVSHEEVMALIGDKALEAGPVQDEETLRQRSRTASSTRAFVSRASMTDLLQRADLAGPHGDSVGSLADITRSLVSPLAYDLLMAGLIDENYTLYCSDYHAVNVSVEAMNFILHCVQPNQADYLFRFDDATSITGVAEELEGKFLQGESVFNVDVFDYYLVHDSGQLDPALARLVRPSDPQVGFLDVYLNNGSQTGLFVQALIRMGWPAALTHLAHTEEIDADTRLRLIDVALLAADASVDYETSDELISLIADSYAEMQAFTSDLDSARADALADLLSQLGARFEQLTVLGGAQRRAIADRGLYPITAHNVRAALETDHTPALDQARELNPRVYEHLLREIERYIAILQPNEPAVAEGSAFAGILNDVSDNAPDAVASVARRAHSSCVIGDVTELESDSRPGVASAGRFLTTAANVSVLLHEFGLTHELAEVIGQQPLTSPDAVSAADRSELAVAIANSAHLASAPSVRRIEDLALDDELDVELLDQHGLSKLPELLGAGHVADEPATYESIAERPFVLRERFFEASRRLADYVTAISLTAEDLAKFFRSSKVSVDAKRALAADAAYLSQHLDRGSAIALAQWAQKGHNLEVAVLAVLSEKRAPAEYIIELLAPLLPGIDSAELERILRGLGDPYELLVQLGHHRPKLSPHEGTTELLDELKKRGFVSSYKTLPFGSSLRVNMRH
jgi:hypothetical protein